METPVVNQPLTLEEFLAGDYESYEFVEGKLVPIAAAKIIHGEISVNIIFHLVNYVREHKLGKLYTNETVFQLDLDFGQNERVLGQKTRERENAKTGQRKELDTVSFSTMADWINNSVL